MVEPKTILDDAASGNLPNYAVVTPNGPGRGGTSQHNGNSMLNGDNWIGQMVRALENGPEWDSTAIFITYDDCGCFYDHVPPGVNADGSKQGVRLPMVIVSPWAKPGFTDSNPTSLVGILSFVEHTFGLTPLNEIDQNAYDFANSFDFTHSPTAPVQMKRSWVPPENRDLESDPDDPT
jgi:phospholipase C